MTPGVRSKPPPLWLVKYVLNPMMRRLLPTRLGRWIPFGVIRVTGRRSGRRLEIPCGIYDCAAGEVAFTDGAWAANIRGGVDVELVRGGRARHVHAELVEDGARVGPWLREVLAAGASARILGIVVPKDHRLTDAEAAELRRAVLLTSVDR